MPSSRIQWIDFCRVWTASFVIVRHTYAPGGSIVFLADLFNYRSLIFVFFFLSGFFSKDNLNPTLRGGYQWLDFRRFMQILMMFAFWSLVGCVFLLPLNYPMVWQHGEVVWSNVVTALGITWTFGWNVPLWFLRVLMVLALFAPVLRRCSSGLLAVFIAGMMAAGEVFCEEAWDEGGNAPGWVPYRMYESLYAWAFFAGGILVKREVGTDKLTEFVTRYSWLIILFAVALFVPVRLWGFLPPCRSGALVMLGVGTIMSIGCLAQRFTPRLCNYVASWGPAAFFIYVTHDIILPYLKLLWLNFFEWNTAGAMVIPLITLCVCCCLFIFLRRICPGFMRWAAMVKIQNK